MQVVRAPQSYTPADLARPVVFCAGSIEQGSASDWQAHVAARFAGRTGTLLSPRREAWDPSWPNTPDFEPFHEQVSWELDGLLDTADIAFVHFEAGTRSPITLLELGLLLADGIPLAVSCSPEFWRYGNVMITCARYGVDVRRSFDDALDRLDQLIAVHAH